MVKTKLICEFVLCHAEFYNHTNAVRRHCSDECRRSAEILKWAPTLLAMRQEGKSHREVGNALGINKNAALLRAIRLQKHLEKHPSLAMALKDHL